MQRTNFVWVDLNRSSHQRCSVKKVLSRPATLLKKKLWHTCFHVNFAKFLITPFFTEQLWTTASSYAQMSLRCFFYSCDKNAKWKNTFKLELKFCIFEILIFLKNLSGSYKHRKNRHLRKQRLESKEFNLIWKMNFQNCGIEILQCLPNFRDLQSLISVWQ